MDQRRAGLSKSSIEGENYWSLNLRGVRFYLSLGVLVLTIIGISHAAVNTTGKQIFREQLEVFHARAIPSIASLVDEKIALHHSESVIAYNRYISEFRQNDALIEQRLNTMGERMANIERMIERLYNREFNSG